MADAPPETSKRKTDGESRRSFFALVTGGLATLPPLIVGLITFFSPLKRKAQSTKVRVALLEQVPDDGMPRAFSVVADRVDAWNRFAQQRIGAVYLVRAPGEELPIALTAKCPHAGCYIGYQTGDDNFQCPCHTSAFHLDGSRMRGDNEVSPRDMDRLDVELRELALSEGDPRMEIWVDFVDYQTGHKEKIPSV